LKHDIAIIGGGIMGSASAYFLTRSASVGSVVVVEPDPSYEFATTPQGAGGVRQQFSVLENIEMSRFSLEFYKNFDAELVDIPNIPDINFTEQGYLFVVTRAGEETLRHNQAVQSSHGVQAKLIDYAEIRRRFPSIQRDDIVLGCLTQDDGWIDPNGGLWGVRRAAEHLGARYIKARVVDIEANSNKVRSIVLDNGNKLSADFFLNTAGPWVSDIALMTGVILPIVPMCRVQHFWQCSEPVERMPLVKDESGMFFRSEGSGFVGGCPSSDIE